MTIENQPSLIMQLPDELQIKILGELPVRDLLKSTVICRKWNTLVYDGSLWTSIDATPFHKSLPIEVIIKLIKSSSRFLKTANFRGCIQLTGHALRTLSDECPNLQVLIIKDCRCLSTASVSYFLRHAKRLRVLDVSGLDTVKTSTLLNTSLDKLEKLDMSWCRNITGPGIISIVHSSSATLTYLKINGCSELDGSILAEIGFLLPHLTHLSLAACTNLTDVALLGFFYSHVEHTQLTHLNLSNCVQLTDRTLRHLALYAKELTHLELAGCLLMTDQGFTHLAPHLQTLMHLDLEDLQHITETTIRSFANHQPHLRRLCLSNCTQISDDAIEHLVVQGCCHQLEHLELDNCTITDKVLNNIAVYLQQQKLKSQHLKRISTTSTTLSSADSSVHLPSSPMAPSIVKDVPSSSKERRINIEVLDCVNITESGVREALTKASPMLTIKSFYLFQQENDHNEEIATNDEQAVDNIHRQHHTRTGSSVRYSTLSSNSRRRAMNHSIHAAGQHHSSANCIIL